jgi:hypothetical protein
MSRVLVCAGAVALMPAPHPGARSHCCLHHWQVHLTRIRMRTVPTFDPDGGCAPYLKIYCAEYTGGGATGRYQLVPTFDSKRLLAVNHYKHEDVSDPPRARVHEPL